VGNGGGDTVTVVMERQTRNDYNRFNKYKVLVHAEKIKNILGDNIVAPIEWVVYPSNICGYRCGHCIMALEHKDHRKMLSKEAMEKIPGDAEKYCVRTLIFSGGGDPILNPFTNKVAGEAKSLGVQVGLNTQGYLEIEHQNYNFIRYSIDAATPETYQRIHRVPKGDGWERLNENLARQYSFRDKGGKTELGMAFLITPSNYFEVREFCQWAQEYEPDFVHIRPAFLADDYLDKEYPDGDKKLRESVVPNLLELALEMEATYQNVYFRVDKFQGFWTEKLYKQCRATPLMAVTSGDGAFLICQDRGIMKEENYLRWGDYNKQSFEDIWWSQEHKDVIKRIDLDNCPRCVLNGYNEIIEHGFVKNSMKMDLL
jgi:GTP 3',8-cyclase